MDTKPIIPLCQHMFTPDRRCGSPAMRGAHFCYYHRQNRTFRGPEIIPDLRSRHNIQRALSNVLRAAIHGRLSSEELGRIVNGIAVAMRTMPRAIPAPRPQRKAVYTTPPIP